MSLPRSSGRGVTSSHQGGEGTAHGVPGLEHVEHDASHRKLYNARATLHFPAATRRAPAARPMTVYLCPRVFATLKVFSPASGRVGRVPRVLAPFWFASPLSNERERAFSLALRAATRPLALPPEEARAGGVASDFLMLVSGSWRSFDRTSFRLGPIVSAALLRRAIMAWGWRRGVGGVVVTAR
jgi:hypothetical protein